MNNQELEVMLLGQLAGAMYQKDGYVRPEVCVILAKELLAEYIRVKHNPPSIALESSTGPLYDPLYG